MTAREKLIALIATAVADEMERRAVAHHAGIAAAKREEANAEFGAWAAKNLAEVRG